MPQEDAGIPLLDADQARFLSGPVAINVASHDPSMTPSVARAYGCRLAGDLRRLTVFVSALRSRVLLRDLGAGAPIAVVFTRPRSHQTLQVKGACADLSAPAPDDLAIMHAYGEAFGAEIRALGCADYFVRALTAPVDEEAVALTFAPAAVYEQTPGPDAGRRLESPP